MEGVKLNIDTKHHIESVIKNIDRDMKGIDTHIRFGNEATAELSKAFNALSIAKHNLKEAIDGN